MEAKILLKKYYDRLTKEAFIKALLWGFVVGLSVLFVLSAVWWLAGLNHVWVCAIFFAVSTAGATPIFYYKKFRPTVKKTAQRVDALGLEERLLTMTELERETTFIAIRQREDARAAVKPISERLLKLALSVSLTITLAIVSVFSVGMTTVAVLGEMGVIPTGKELIRNLSATKPKIFKITYEVRGKGIINGIVKQSVEEGQNAAAVFAVPNDEWVFAGWSDGDGNPYRMDALVSRDITVYAIFEEVSPFVEDDDEVDGISFDSGGGGGGGGDGGGGGEYSPINFVFDGKTYYGGNVFENAVVDAAANAAAAGDSDFVGGYFEIIAK